MEEAIADLLGNDKEALLHTLQTLDPVHYLSSFVAASVRPDGRALHGVRPTSVSYGVCIRNSVGSALVRIGATQVTAAVTVQVGRPSAATPTCGEVEVAVTMGPCCGPMYDVRHRVLSTDADDVYVDRQRALESWLGRTLRSDRVVALEGLCLAEGKAAWKLTVDVVVLNHAGNVEDAAWSATVAALRDARLPAAQVGSDGTVRLVPGAAAGTPVTLRCLPVPLTVALFCPDAAAGRGSSNSKDEHDKGYVMLVDPTDEEEAASSGSLTVVVALEEDRPLRILSVNKPGGKVVVKTQDVAACVQLCRGRAVELTSILSGRDDDTTTTRIGE